MTAAPSPADDRQLVGGDVVQALGQAVQQLKGVIVQLEGFRKDVSAFQVRNQIADGVDGHHIPRTALLPPPKP